jgi:hypothetical protein
MALRKVGLMSPLEGPKAVVPNETHEIKIFISNRDSVCDECHEDLGRHAWIRLAGERGALCLACADLDHLVYLPAGDAALSRRARKHSQLSAIVLKWSTDRKRYERQGILVEEQALAQAERECLDDHAARERRREREALRRDELDQEYLRAFADRVRGLYPRCPGGRERVIAEHACRKYSGRVGRSAAAKRLDEEAVRLAVEAHIRHSETDYDKLLRQGLDRRDARHEVRDRVWQVIEGWGSD